MARKILSFSLFLLLISVLSASAQDWAGKGRAAGRVTNESGDPIEGAKVTLVQFATGTGPEAMTTNKKGRWSYLGLGGGAWKVVIEAPGYKISEGSLSVNEFQANPPVEITLYANPYSSIDVGDELLESQRFAEARAEYQKALPNLEPGPAARLRSRIGDTFMAEGDYAAARAEYEQALPHIPTAEQTQIRLQMGNSYQQEQQFAKAREQYEVVLPLISPAPRAQVMLSIARGYDLAGDREAAIETLEKALELAPDNVQLLQVIADLLTRAGREEEARAYLDQMPEGVALPTDMVLNIGIRLYNEGKTEKAYDYFDRAVREDPDLAESYYYRGLVRLSRSDNDGARADFEKLLELEPENSHAAEAQEFLSFLAADG